jgi:hypothetical protein
MKHKEIIILGSGTSINDLSKEEIAYINNCEAIIAVNKFMAYYKKTGIKPNMVYYVDNYHINVKQFLNYIFKVCRRDGLTNITFFVSKNIRNTLFVDFLPYIFEKTKYVFKRFVRKLLYGKSKTFIEKFFFLAPKNNNFMYVKNQTYLVGGDWAESLDEVLFQYRGSLSTVLNLSTILYPGYTIKLIGTDFNSGKYFFDNELQDIEISWQDHTTEKVREEDTHWSVLPIKGTTMFDKFPFILNKLKENNNEIYCCNKQSLLVTENYIPYAPVIPGSEKDL